MATNSRKKTKRVEPVTKKVTVLKTTTPKKEKTVICQIKSSSVEALREHKFELFYVLSNIITKAIDRQRQAEFNYLEIEFEFDLVKRIFTITDNSVGLSRGEVIAIPLEVGFGVNREHPEFSENLSILELATYYGNTLELLSVTNKETSWIHVNIFDMMNTEKIDVIEDKNVKKKDVVASHIPNTGVKFQITEIPFAYEIGFRLIPSPKELDDLREKLAISFSDVMQDFDLVIKLSYKAKIVTDYKKEKEGEAKEVELKKHASARGLRRFRFRRR